MAQVFVVCPRTGKPVYPGIAGSRESLAKSNFINCSVQCPYCQTPHLLSNATAKIQG